MTSATACSSCTWTWRRSTTCLPAAGSGRWTGATWRSSGAATTSATRRMPLDHAVRDRVGARAGRAPDGPDPPADPRPLLRRVDEPGEFLLRLPPPTGKPWTGCLPKSPTPRGASATPTCCRCPTPCARATALHWDFAKRFHVSPFLPMDRTYHWAFEVPGPTLRVHMDVLAGEHPRIRRDPGPAAPRPERQHTGFMPGAVSLADREGRGGHLLAGGPALAQARHVPPPSHHPRHTTGPESLMSSPAESFHSQALSQPAYGALDRFLRRRLLERLAAIRGGELRIIDAYGETLVGTPDPGDAPACHLAHPRRGLLPRGRREWFGRRRRSLHGRPVDLRRPGGPRPHPGAQPRPARWHGRRPGETRRLGDANLAWLPPQHPRRQPEEHRRALRPRQSVVQAFPRRQHDVFVGDLHLARRRPGNGIDAQARAHLRKTAALRRRPPARDRHRLGRHGPVCGHATTAAG